MANVVQVAQNYRGALMRREAQVEADLARTYVEARRNLEDALDDVTRFIVQAQNRGLTPDPEMIYRQARLFTLLEQVESEVGKISDGMGASLDRIKSEAIDLGDDFAHAIMGESGLPPTARLPNDELIELVSRMSPESPVRASLDNLAGEARDRVEEQLVQGIVAGWGPGEVAFSISRELGTDLARTMRIARTEMIQAYRNAALVNYRRRPHIIRGWIWTAALASDPPPCPVCAGLHGQVFPLDEPFGSHPGCRCAPAPYTGSGEVEFQPGTEWFDEQSAAVQREMLGPAGFLAYEDGVVSLTDFAVQVDDPVWGPQWKRQSLWDVLGPEASVYYARLR